MRTTVSERRHPFRAAALVLAAAAATCAPAGAQVERRNAVVRAVEKVGPAVVNVSTEVLVRNPYYDWFDPFDWFFGRGPHAPGRTMVQNSLGSGVIVDPEGYVLTNDHVVSAASRITVTLADGRQVEAELVGGDRASDLAVLKLAEPGPWPSVPMGRSDDLMIGETLIAIGNPFGLQNTVTVGVLSAKGRTLTGPDERTQWADFLQTDAAINPGNSGGALLDIEGRLVGINTQIVAGGQNLGFAIPIDRARKVFEELKRFGKLRPAWTGLVVAELGDAEARALGLRPGDGGLLVRKVYRDSPATEAGIGAGDVILAVGGRAVDSRAEFDTAIAETPYGEALELEIWHEGSKATRRLVVQAFPEERVPEFALRLLGFTVEEGRGGLVVTKVDPESDLGRRGLRPGVVLVSLNGRRMRRLADFNDAVPRLVYSRSASLVLRAGRQLYRVIVPVA
ncbi:MAG: PDZ domain-containing protein [Acidobacteria bacterium]|nr:MAG: PDZ domain-containing protein [Acidobacteriota bacterium]